MLTPLYRGLSSLGMAQGGAALDWWLGGGTMPLANVKEHVENPTQGQLYAGGTLADAWSVSFCCTLAALLTVNQYAFDSQTGRMLIGKVGATEGVFTTEGFDRDMFATGTHTYMVVSDGVNITIYRDNVQLGDPISTAVNIGGTTRWRSNNSGVTNQFTANLRSGHVANIALDATQRDGLHASMMALA